MKVNLTAEVRAGMDLMGFEDFPRSSLIPAEINLSPEAQKAIEVYQKAFGESGKTPIGHMDVGDHGQNSGIVFISGLYERIGLYQNNMVNPSFATWDVKARVSCGPDNSMRGKWRWNTPFVWDGSLGRFHISAWAERMANPCVKGEDSFSCDKEKIHFSMRWVEGKFDDWSSLRLWKKNIGSTEMDKKSFDKNRTTYYSVWEGHPENNFNNQAARLVAVVGQRKRILPQLELLDDFAKTHPETPAKKWEELLGSDGTRHVYQKPTRVVTIGYTPVHKILSKFGDVSESDAGRLKRMTPMQGVEYTFGKVLPALIEYARER